MRTFSDSSKAIFMVFAAFSLFSISDTCAKCLGGSLSSQQIVGSTSTLIAFFSAGIIFVTGGAFQTSSPRAHTFRSFMMTASALVNFAILPYINLSQFYTVMFTTPLLIALIAYFFLNEYVSGKAIGAILIGFVGVLMGVATELQTMNLWILALLASPVCFAFGSISSRNISREESPLLMAFFPKALSALLFAPYTYSFLSSDFTSLEMGLVSLMALCDMGAYVALGLGYQRGRSSILAPLQYVQMLWGILFGVVVFRVHPHILELCGAFLVMICGYVVIKERSNRE